LKKIILISLGLIFGFLSLNAGKLDDAWVQYGAKLLEAKQYEKSIIAFEKALYINPDNYLAYEYAGKAYIGLNDKASALGYYQKAYDINPSPEIKKIADDLNEHVNGLKSLTFYPLIFEAYILTNYHLTVGSDGSTDLFSPSNFSFGGGVFATYYLNDWFALKTGAILVSESGDFYESASINGYYPAIQETSYNATYLDFPIAPTVTFRFPWAQDMPNSFSAGGYFGIKTGGEYSNTQYFQNSKMPGSDMGLYFGGNTYNYFWGPVAIVANLIVEYSMVKLYPNVNANSVNIILALGAAF
jgi:hypothetical protein